MTQPTNDLDQPLGQPGAPKPKRHFTVRGRGVGIAVGALCMVAASSAIAFREQPFRNPAAMAVSTPEMVSAPVGTATLPAKQEVSALAPVKGTPTRSDGPSIIHVNPEDDGKASGVVVIRDPSSLGQNLRVAHLPDKDLIEVGDSGPLPIRSADGKRPVDVYARPWSGARGARVAIVLGGLALSQTGTQSAIEKLPPEVTLAFAPQGNSIGRWMAEARRDGHEIVMQVPLEPFDYPNVNPGRNTLTVAATAEENLKNLRWTLSRTTNYTGVMNYMGGRFVTDQAAMAPLMEELAKRGLLYLDDGSTARSVASDLALKDGVPFAASDAAIDASRDRGAILKKLDQLEATARAKGFAVGTGSAFDVTVDAVTSWIAEAKKRGIEIVPVSAVAIDPEKG